LNYNDDNKLIVFWGYDELANNDNLMDRVKNAENIFYKRKEEIDEEEKYF